MLPRGSVPILSQPELTFEPSPQELRRQARVGPIEHPAVGVAHDRRQRLVARAGGLHPGGECATQVVRRAVVDAGATRGVLYRPAELIASAREEAGLPAR